MRSHCVDQRLCHHNSPEAKNLTFSQLFARWLNERTRGKHNTIRSSFEGSFCCCCCYNCIVPLGFLPWKIWVAFPGESQCNRVALPNLRCMLQCFHNFTEPWRRLVVAFFPACENFGRVFDNSFPASAFCFFSGDQLAHTNSLFRPGSVHSGSASWEDCDIFNVRTWFFCMWIHTEHRLIVLSERLCGV